MNTHSPGSPTKLPAYSAPSLNPIRPPSPLTGDTDYPLSSFVAPTGCELILRNPNKASDGSTLKLAKAAMKNIASNNVEFQNLLLDVIGTGNPARDSNLSYCYARLKPSVAALDTSPRPDLLWQWQPHLLDVLQG